MRALIEVEDISFSYIMREGNKLPALSNISLCIAEGEFVAIIGANGSGKSTLARHFNALLIPDSGKVLIAGMDTRDTSNHRKIRTDIGIVFQSPEDQIVATTVEEDVAFGPENLALPSTEIQCRVETALRDVNLWDERFRPPHLLSAGQMQRVALAGALAMRPRCIIFDETTAMLDPLGRHTVMEMMSKMHHEGLTIIYITHFMEEAACASRVLVLNQGALIMDGSPIEVFSQSTSLEKIGLTPPPAMIIANTLRHYIPSFDRSILTVEDLIHSIPERFISNNTKMVSNKAIPTLTPHSENIIDVKNLGYTYMLGTPFSHRALDGVSLQVEYGEAHALLGATGSGKSTLLQHLNALLRPQQGSVRVGNFELDKPDVDVKAVRHLAGLAFQNPEMQLFEQYVGDEIAYGLRLIGENCDIRQRVRWAMEMVELDFESYKDRLTFSLSGGERRKVALASILALQPKILLLDEPLAGLDPLSRQDFLNKIKVMQSSDMTILLSTHYMDDVVTLGGKLTVMGNGRDLLKGTASTVFSQTEAIRSLGLLPPIVAKIAEGFRDQGWNIPIGVVDLKSLCTFLENER